MDFYSGWEPDLTILPRVGMQILYDEQVDIDNEVTLMLIQKVRKCMRRFLAHPLRILILSGGQQQGEDLVSPFPIYQYLCRSADQLIHFAYSNAPYEAAGVLGRQSEITLRPAGTGRIWSGRRCVDSRYGRSSCNHFQSWAFRT